MISNREIRKSDEGYQSNDSSNSPTISPIKNNPECNINIKLINKEAKEFRSKYFTKHIINNSANGVVYEGIILHVIIT